MVKWSEKYRVHQTEFPRAMTAVLEDALQNWKDTQDVEQLQMDALCISSLSSDMAKFARAEYTLPLTRRDGSVYVGGEWVNRKVSHVGCDPE